MYRRLPASVSPTEKENVYRSRTATAASCQKLPTSLTRHARPHHLHRPSLTSWWVERTGPRITPTDNSRNRGCAARRRRRSCWAIGLVMLMHWWMAFRRREFGALLDSLAGPKQFFEVGLSTSVHWFDQLCTSLRILYFACNSVRSCSSSPMAIPFLTIYPDTCRLPIIRPMPAKSFYLTLPARIFWIALMRSIFFSSARSGAKLPIARDIFSL